MVPIYLFRDDAECLHLAVQRCFGDTQHPRRDGVTPANLYGQVNQRSAEQYRVLGKRMAYSLCPILLGQLLHFFIKV